MNNVLFVLALLMIPYSLVWIITPANRAKGKVMLPASIVAAAFFGVSGAMERNSADAMGFATIGEMNRAVEAGFDNAAAWEAHQLATAGEREEAKLREAAEKLHRERRVAESNAAADVACMKELQCWGDKHSLPATAACRPYVEQLASLNYRWTDGWTESKFSHFRWRQADEGVITFIGDKIEYQNGLGNWIRHTYECDFDPRAKQALDVRARVGMMR